MRSLKEIASYSWQLLRYQVTWVVGVIGIVAASFDTVRSGGDFPAWFYGVLFAVGLYWAGYHVYSEVRAELEKRLHESAMELDQLMNQRLQLLRRVQQELRDHIQLLGSPRTSHAWPVAQSPALDEAASQRALLDLDSSTESLIRDARTALIRYNESAKYSNEKVPTGYGTMDKRLSKLSKDVIESMESSVNAIQRELDVSSDRNAN